MTTREEHLPLMIAGALCGAVGVALAARGSHTADGNISIAANFLMLHASALLVIGFIARGRVTVAAGWVLLAGLLLFSGDLVARSTMAQPLFPLAAPIGGIGLIGGWLLLALALIVDRRRS